MIIVNYYSRSYGDTIASMIANAPINKINGTLSDGTKSTLPQILKNPNAYKLIDVDFTIQTFFKTNKNKYVALPAHRQHGFDYKRLEKNCTVISIVPDLAEKIAARVMHIDTWKEEHPILSKLFDRLSTDEKIKYTAKTIVSWQEKNILSSDISILFSNLYKLKELDLPNYDESVIDDIYSDIERYAS